MSSNTLTYEQIPPIRPAIDDVGGGAKINDTVDPPDALTMPTAEDANQTARQLVALGTMTECARFTVAFAVGAPFIETFAVVRTDKVLGDFTIVDNGVGDTTIKWAAATFPAKNSEPHVSVNEDVDHRGAIAFMAVFGADRGVRVKTRDGAGAPADRKFTVSVYGE